VNPSARIEIGTLGDDVDRSTWFTAPEQRRIGPFEDLDPLDPGDIAGTAEAAAAIEAVDEIARWQVLVAGEAADGISIPQPAEIVLPRDRGGQIQGIGQPGEVVGVDLFLADLGDRLGGFAQGKVAAIGLTLAGDDDVVGIVLHRHRHAGCHCDPRQQNRQSHFPDVFRHSHSPPGATMSGMALIGLRDI
jgi:hypothetical protein